VHAGLESAWVGLRRTRWLGPGLLLIALPLLCGCGVSDPANATGSQLEVYSSLPLEGPSAADSTEVVDGEKLALSDAGGRAGRFRVGYVSLDDSNPTTGAWEPGLTASDAKTAAQDTSTIAYLGELDSAATALSLPIINSAGILQISTSSPYVGLTAADDAGQDEPERFYPTGKRNFVRLDPGDPVQAAAQVELMKQLGVGSVYVLDNEEEPFNVPLASLVAGDAARSGITVAGQDSISTRPGASFAGEAEKISKSGAQAVFLSGSPGEGTAALWRELHAVDPSLWLLGSSEMVEEAFTHELGSAEERTLLTTSDLPASSYPPSARAVLSSYNRHFGAQGGAYALYGYEAMTLVLYAIQAAGRNGNDRNTVIQRVFSVRNRNSVIGGYSIDPSGETTLSRYGVDRIYRGRPTFLRAIDTASVSSGAPTG
jgi:branched-chain amino acid transport system substrate-binding protein